jgi:sterol desaturase/sphingolipid hydroxylase (fatty acid hydroxylase superfamily)
MLRFAAHNPNVVLMLCAAVGVAVEFVGLRLARRTVDYSDARFSIAMAFSWAGARLFGGKALMLAAWLSVYALVPWHWDLHQPTTWVAYFLIGDLVYYATHRAEHRLRVLWASHLIHHSSEELNMTTAIRMPWTEVFYKPLIALWAPLLGFHPVTYVVFGALSLAAGQWQHLDWFPKVRWLDAVFMSPSNHRVHHASNREYLDRNFGGALVVWDKLFGTYTPETVRPVYGVLHLPPAANAAARSLGGYPELWQQVRSSASLTAGLRLAVARPA